MGEADSLGSRASFPVFGLLIYKDNFIWYNPKIYKEALA